MSNSPTTTETRFEPSELESIQNCLAHTAYFSEKLRACSSDACPFGALIRVYANKGYCGLFFMGPDHYKSSLNGQRELAEKVYDALKKANRLDHEREEASLAIIHGGS
jgi:hypothetical protein